ncbi:uncharacterized protein (DUF4415 family) [Rhodoplanes tepidamans]|uniref:BrnA antitoxin family protein n=1 Tax=Rhodoplanes tepidamans TaxID=200616 RepID=A0ABT5J710_RHOTP|nr:BrnA antitoxin family protein [Rhodoplanes tepidamans]MDC7785298.1 BrnA antitoxin family protein [Rhodoplanes tepidamans]MDQ0353556.1 uncharacterized protein (DUF4415 family) [Rhodoplanes tepidamans]
MKKKASDLTPDQMAELEALAAQPEARIDTTDVPEQRDWSGARRGLFFRPVKQQITLRLGADVIDWFRKNPFPDEGWQTSINRVLRDYVGKHERERT